MQFLYLLGERRQNENEGDGETIITMQIRIKKLSMRFSRSQNLLVTRLAVLTYRVSVIHLRQVVMTLSPEISINRGALTCRQLP